MQREWMSVRRQWLVGRRSKGVVWMPVDVGVEWMTQGDGGLNVGGMSWVRRVAVA